MPPVQNRSLIFQGLFFVSFHPLAVCLDVGTKSIAARFCSLAKLCKSLGSAHIVDRNVLIVGRRKLAFVGESKEGEGDRRSPSSCRFLWKAIFDLAGNSGGLDCFMSGEASEVFCFSRVEGPDSDVTPNGPRFWRFRAACCL